MANKTAFDMVCEAAPTISVGMLTADLLKLGAELAIIEQAGVKVLHVDVMDGCFCPMTTVGPPLIKAMKTPMLKDVHLMINDPLEKLDSYVAAGADLITVHVESCAHPHRALQVLGQMTNANDPERGIVRGVGLNPSTPLEVLDPLMDELEMIFLVAINPGWGGQGFIPATERRIRRVIEMIKAGGRDILIGVDGGIKKTNVAGVAAMGADLIVTGSAVFDGSDKVADNARFMLDAVAGVK